MDYLPVFFDLKRTPALVVGAGTIALRKIRLLLKAHSNIIVVSPKACDEIQKLAESGKLRWKKRKFTRRDLAGVRLVVSATDRPDVSEYVYRLASKKGIPVNTVDNRSLCDFIFPAIVDRDPITIAVGSDGTAPVLSRMIRTRIEATLPASVSVLGKLAKDYRDQVKSSLTDLQQRREFWENVFSGKVRELVESNRLKEAEDFLVQSLHAKTNQDSTQGEVFIVGAGPGDPELLTIRALQCLQRADVIVHDGLVSEDILDLARRDADRISVAKKAGSHTLPQNEINELIINLAKQGAKVCRLKGGDPFIFGRGGEECEALSEANISFTVVPAVSAASGCSASARIPLTHRDYAQTIQIVTGHCRKDGDEPDWAGLAREKQTIVVYMGLIRSEHLASKLIENGRSPDTPVALVENGSLKTERVVIGQLKDLPDLIHENQIQSPALIIIGEVASLHERLKDQKSGAWNDKQFLFATARS